MAPGQFEKAYGDLIDARRELVTCVLDVAAAPVYAGKAEASPTLS